MKGRTMKASPIGLAIWILVVVFFAHAESSIAQVQEPELYDHFVAMQQTQQRLSQLSPEEKERLQPKVRRAEIQACQKLWQDQQKGVREDDYLRQGGEVFVAYVLQFERYCQTLR
jgi:hypothetical protein